MQKIMSWNVASVRARLPLLMRLLAEEKPDVLMLQETKVVDDSFPLLEIKAAGYDVLASGQKALNGVAILSRQPQLTIRSCLDGFADEARFIECAGTDGIHYISVYVPNGNPPMNNPSDTTRLDYKLRWMTAFNEYVSGLLAQKISFVIGGDFNVIEADGDVYNPALFQDSALMIAPVRQKFKQLRQLGIVSAIRQYHTESGLYSFWDFQGGAWQKNNGILLDALFVSPDLGVKLKDAGVQKQWRGLEKPSDHTPVWCQINV